MSLRFGEIDAFYRCGMAETVQSVHGSFSAFVDLAEPDAFDRARITTHSLRFPAGIELAANDLLTIAAGAHAGDYKVSGQPQRINGSEYIAELVKV